MAEVGSFVWNGRGKLDFTAWSWQQLQNKKIAPLRHKQKSVEQTRVCCSNSDKPGHIQQWLSYDNTPLYQPNRNFVMRRRRVHISVWSSNLFHSFTLRKHRAGYQMSVHFCYVSKSVQSTKVLKTFKFWNQTLNAHWYSYCSLFLLLSDLFVLLYLSTVSLAEC